MGNDWRLFRAQLIAQEQRDTGDQEQHYGSSIMGDQCDELHDEWEGGKSLNKAQNQLGNLLKDAFSIFSQSAGTMTAAPVKEDQGVADSNPLCNNNDKDPSPTASLSNECESSENIDPFASADELFAITHPSIALDKHKWAHPLSHVEPGCTLIATEKLRGVFRQTVVLIIDHHEVLGTTGVVINRPLSGTLQQIANSSPSNIDTSLKLAFAPCKVSYGGPVMSQDFSILHNFGAVEGSKKVAPGVFVGGSRELMNEVRLRNFRPEDALFVKGHASWQPGQLEKEIKRGVWYVAAVSSDFILDKVGGGKEEGDLWFDVLRCMGGKYGRIAERFADGKKVPPESKRMMP